jgi:hypothetical protein
MSPHQQFLRGQDTNEHRAPGERSVGQDLDNIFRLTAAQPAGGPNGAGQNGTAEGQQPVERVWAGEPHRVSQPDLDAALDMLNRAAKAMDLMQARYQHVEDYAKGVADRAEKDIAIAYAQARESELRAAESESQLEDLRTRTVGAERRAEQAERNAKEARDWLECFYDKIVTSFDTRAVLKSRAA